MRKFCHASRMQKAIKSMGNYEQWVELFDNRMRQNGLQKLCWQAPPELWKRLADSLVTQDNFLVSWPYLLLTGREGLWVYCEEESCVPLCCHPNNIGRILVFPPMGKNGMSALRGLIEKMPQPPQRAQLARFSDQELRNVQSQKDGGKIVLMDEPLLDWKYPCYVLDTKRVAGHRGQKLANMRKMIGRAQKQNANIELITDWSSALAKDSITNLWTNCARSSCASQGSEKYYEALVHMLENAETTGVANTILGILCHVNETVVACIFWEEQRRADTAVGICHALLSNTRYAGASELAVWAMCDTLARRGVPHVWIGGSEDRNLDSFKRKFNPSGTYRLYSAEIR